MVGGVYTALHNVIECTKAFASIAPKNARQALRTQKIR